MMSPINDCISRIGELHHACIQKTQEKLDNLTKPRGSLGRLEEIAKNISGMTGRETRSFKDKVIFTLAADHGIVDEGVSAYPKEVTSQMVHNFLRGGAAINVLARHAGARVIVADLGVASDFQEVKGLIIKKINHGTKNMFLGPAMTREEALQSVHFGMEIFEQEFKKGADLIATGEMGIGNTTAASAITAVILRKPVADVTGKGTGIDDAGLARKVRTIEKAIALNRPNPAEPMDVLSKVGGFEIGGLAGIILAAAARSVPILLDGFISGAAALIAYSLAPKAKNFMIAAHCSVEKGHQAILERLGLRPLLDFDLRLGEGTGAALAMPILDASLKILNEMATFQSAAVSKKIKK